MRSLGIAKVLFLLTTVAPVAVSVLAADVDQPRNCHEHHYGAFSDWSTAVSLGPIVNSSDGDLWPAIAPSDLSLYFASFRDGGQQDIWVTQRSSPTAAWETPQRLGPNINTSARDNTPYISADGHWLLFSSNRPGGCGNNDLYISFRTNTLDDYGWEAPLNLGCQVNSAGNDVAPRLVVDDDAGTTTLYFTSNRLGGISRIYASSQQSDGTFGTPVAVQELTSNLDPPSFGDGPAWIRNDGLEMILNWNTVINPFSDGDLWVSTRASLADPWSLPQILGTVNTSYAEANPSLSCDGTALYFTSDRPGGSGGLDLWVSKRTPLVNKLP